jgi:hypothetical protein
LMTTRAAGAWRQRHSQQQVRSGVCLIPVVDWIIACAPQCGFAACRLLVLCWTSAGCRRRYFWAGKAYTRM